MGPIESVSGHHSFRSADSRIESASVLPILPEVQTEHGVPMATSCLAQAQREVKSTRRDLRSGEREADELLLFSAPAFIRSLVRCSAPVCLLFRDTI
jgi:hypothetical protein